MKTVNFGDYKQGSAQQVLSTGNLADETLEATWVTPAVIQAGGNFIVTQPDGNGDADVTVTFNGVTKSGMRSVTHQFAATLKASTPYKASVKVAGPTKGLLFKLLIPGHKTARP